MVVEIVIAFELHHFEKEREEIERSALSWGARAMAMEKVPQLATVISVDAVSNMGRQSIRNAGAFELRCWNWIMLNAGRGNDAAQAGAGV